MSSTLDMTGHIDDDFESVDATRTSFTGGKRVDGRWQKGTPENSPHTVNLQPLTMRERQIIENGGERIVDGRKVYVNDGDLYSVSEADEWTFDGVEGTFKVASLDNRPWNGYCKIIVGRKDDR